RHYAAIGEGGLKPENCVERLAGSITIDNDKYLRYQGEIQITVNDLPADEKVNVLGRVIDEDCPLLNKIKGNQKFMIERVCKKKGSELSAFLFIIEFSFRLRICLIDYRLKL